MEQKAKFIIIGLIGLLIISLFLAFQLYSAKEVVIKERDDLVKQNVALNQKVEANIKEAGQLKNKLSELSRNLDQSMREKSDTDKKLALMSREREDLLDKLEELKKKQAQAPVQQQAPAVGSISSSSADDAYWAGILKAKTDLELQLQNIRSELKNIQITNEQLQRDKSSMGLELSNMTRQRDDLERQLEYNQKIMDSLAAELVREKNDKLKLQDTLKPIKNENEVLVRQIKMLNDRKIALEKDIAKTQDEKMNMERRVSELEVLLKDQILKMGDLKKQVDEGRSIAGQPNVIQQQRSVELPAIVVRPQSGAVDSSIVGKIIAVNRDNGFVVIDLGEDRGIKLGQSFQVYRDNQAIGSVEVIQTRQNISACDIKRETSPIKVGDGIK